MMMILTFETQDKNEYKSFRGLFSSMIQSRFPEHFCHMEVAIMNSDDSRVPYKVNLKVEEELYVSAVSSNIISAFTQALNRLQVKLPEDRCRA
jgi:hypothetical protein